MANVGPPYKTGGLYVMYKNTLHRKVNKAPKFKHVLGTVLFCTSIVRVCEFTDECIVIFSGNIFLADKESILQNLFVKNLPQSSFNLL